MSIDFYPPALRAQGGSGGLNVTVSPLGLIELSDEEYQVHGARLARYALLWSWYLGSHWATLREAGEPQLTFNWVRAFSDFICNFCFARGVYFRAPLATSAIVPALLNRVWTVDNDREKLLWEIGQMGGVTGDAFVKVAYEEPQMWPPMDPKNLIPGVKQRFLPGRVRILPLNSSYCFPIWNPHDRSRLIQFTQKYRFWAPAADGTRQMRVYVEVITDTEIREYVDDILLPGSPRPNPLGRIPIVHIPNTMVSGSPWGLADCQDILSQNRAYNEVATEVLDIVNYYTAPVTVVIGANQQTLQRGANNVWSVPKGAEITNLEGGQAGLDGAFSEMDRLKMDMHSLVGVPYGALGQQQPISNTAGVAVALQYQPMMQRYDLKKILYGQGLRDINEIVLLTLSMKEPETAMWAPKQEGDQLKPGQLAVLDWDDPSTYITETHWPAPLPVDFQRVLLEQGQKMAMGLQSKKGALAEFGEEFPDEKLQQIFAELLEDLINQGAIDMLRQQINASIYESTGMLPPDGSDPGVMSAGGPDVTTAGDGGGGSGGSGDGGGGQPGRPPLFTDTPEGKQVLADVNARIMGTKVTGTRLPGDPT